MKHTLNLPKKVYFKTGSAPVALRELSEVYHCSKALLITDSVLYRSGVAAPVADQLRCQGIRVAEYFSIGEYAAFADVRAALPKLQEFQPDVIIGVGKENAASVAKALMALYETPELDLKQAAANPDLIRPCTKAKLVLIATDFADGTQNTPFAILKDDVGEFYILNSLHLLPEISITDADFAASLTAEEIRSCTVRMFSRAVRAYLSLEGSEFTNGMLLDVMRLILKHSNAACEGCPADLEHLHNAGALAGIACGSNAESAVSDLPLFPTEKERVSYTGNRRCAELSAMLGLDSCEALFDFCETM